MDRQQLQRLDQARELLLAANQILLELADEKDIERRHHNAFKRAHDYLFDLLTSSLNKISHDVWHELTATK